MSKLSLVNIPLFPIFFGLFFIFTSEVLISKLFCCFFVTYVIFNLNEKNLIGLILVTLAGTSVNYYISFLIILFSCKTYKYSNFKSYIRILLVFLPILFSVFIHKIYIQKLSLPESLSIFEYYIPLWFLLFGKYNYKLFTDNFVKNLIISICFLKISSLFITENVSFRIFQFFSILGLFFLFLKIFTRHRNVLFKIKYLSIFPFLIYFEFSLNVLVSLLIIFILFGSIKKKYVFNKLKFVFTLLPLLILFTTIINYNYGFSNPLINSDIDILKNNILDSVEYKLFFDRIPIWDGVLKSIFLNLDYLPSTLERVVTYENYNRTLFEVDFQSHNTFLELIRINGLIIGLLFSYLIAKHVYNILNLYNRVLNLNNLFRIAFFASSISIMSFGQYLIQLNMSFFYFFIMGSLTLTTLKVNVK
ncbi:MAG: hypothetical protein CMC04_03940 [Flavobacteriaceae bacterium]|nr:hypothetical protein [Flavobacteriaceae bacterium]